MKPWHVMSYFVGCLTVLVLTAGGARAQTPPHEGSKAAEAQQLQKIKINGRIGFMKNLGGYYVAGVEPPGTIMIDNQHRSVLKKLKKSGKTVVIEGHQTLGADRMFIEKIDGKSYGGGR